MSYFLSNPDQTIPQEDRCNGFWKYQSVNESSKGIHWDTEVPNYLIFLLKTMCYHRNYNELSSFSFVSLVHKIIDNYILSNYELTKTIS